MKTKVILSSMSLACTLVLVGQMRAIAESDRGDATPADLRNGTVTTSTTTSPTALEGTNPCDVAVSMLGGGNDYAYYGNSGGKSIFTMATTSCNVGGVTCEWIDGSSGRHPLIAQNLYMLNNGRFMQIGQAWLKHSFCAVSEPTCGSCQSTGCSTLGIGCADTYWATLNGGSLGARSDANPLGFSIGGVGGPGTHSHPYTGSAAPYNGRMAVLDTLTGLAGSGVRYFAEAHYLTQDEIISRRHNNATWREVSVTATSMNNTESDGVVQDSDHYQKSALHAWQFIDSNVAMVTADDSEGGRYEIAFSFANNGDGTYHYEYAVRNMNSRMAAGAFELPILDCVNITNAGFYSLGYENESYNNNAWNFSHVDGKAKWEVDQDFTTNPNANALRWGTTHNFWFDADATPVPLNGGIGIFENAAETVATHIRGPRSPIAACAEDCDYKSLGAGACPNDVDVADLLDLLGQWGTNGVCDNDGSNMVDVADLLNVLAKWADCAAS